MKGIAEGMLSDVVVLDLTNEQGSFCAKLLADLGATVIKIESPKGDPSRGSLSFSYCNTRKQSLVLDLDSPEDKCKFRELIKKSGILVETFPPGHLETLRLGYLQLRRINPGLIHISITGFGQTGPKHTYRSCDLVASAYGGQMHVTGAPSVPPTRLFGTQSCYTASLFGANAALLGLRKRKLCGRGCYVDLSLQEAAASTLGDVVADYFTGDRIAGRRRDSSPDDSFSILPCKDGYLQASILRNWETLIELMNAEGKAGNLAGTKWQQRSYRAKHHDRIIKAAGKWTRAHTKHELFELGQSLQFPWAPVESPEEVLKNPQLHARTFFIRVPKSQDYPSTAIPGLPYKFSNYSPPPLKPSPLLGEHTLQVVDDLNASRWKDRQGGGPRSHVKSGNILKGIRVIDMTRMLSGPYATRILGDFGAEVIKVQSRLTAHGAERDDSPYFRAWNRNKRSLSLNLNCPEARDIVLELAAVSDVVVENFSPRVLENWGLTYDRLSKANPDLIMASISAMGQTGPWRNFVGYAPTFHALSGLVSASSRSSDAPINIGFAYGDIVAGLYAAMAILASVEHRDATGKGQYIDLSAYEALCTLLGPAFMKAAGDQRCNDIKETLSGCYPCKGIDRWCAISISNDSGWQMFCRISGITELQSDCFSTPSARNRHRKKLDALVSQWTARYAPEIIVRRLQKAGIPAGIVQNAEDLAKDNHLAARRFYISLVDAKRGNTISDRSAVWPWNERPSGWKPAPQLGADNRYVVQKLLGYSDARFRSLGKKGVLK
jgi:crotonobetainyl-CoA:carnitine CoA-transferase CaiB-like acyl-CoA transferase